MANELAVIDTKKIAIVPSAEDMQFVRDELHDIEDIPFGLAKIAPGGANVFQMYEPGANDDESVSVNEIEGVILMSTVTNAMWFKDLSENTSADKSPDCNSTDGERGIIKATGEVRACSTCPYNQFGSGKDGNGKKCKNTRNVFILRPGDIFPLRLVLPPTSLKAFTNYKKSLVSKRKHMWGVMTKVSLKKMKSQGGIAYSAINFTATGMLPADDVTKLREYATAFSSVAAAVGVSADDIGVPRGAIEARFVEAPDASAVFDAPPPPEYNRHAPADDPFSGFATIE